MSKLRRVRGRCMDRSELTIPPAPHRHSRVDRLLAVLALAAIAVGAAVIATRTPQLAPPTSAEHRLREGLELCVSLGDVPRSTFSEVSFRAMRPGEIGASNSYVALVDAELNCYPDTFLHRSGLGTVAIVRELAVEGQRRAAVPDYPGGVLYLDPDIGNGSLTYQRHVIHHELFHFLIGKLHGDPYFADPKWLRLNDPQATYVAGGKTVSQHGVYTFTRPAPGVINRYSQSAPEEDMAEMFAAMILPEERMRVEEWSREDRVLRAKLNYMID